MQFLTVNEIIENYHDYNDHMGADSMGFMQTDGEDNDNECIYIDTFLISCGNKICKYAEAEPVFLVFDYPGNPPETKEHTARLIEILRYNSAPFYIYNITYEYYAYEVEEIKDDYRNMVQNMVYDMKMQEIKKVLITNEYMQPDVFKFVFLPLFNDE